MENVGLAVVEYPAEASEGRARIIRSNKERMAG